MLGWAAPPAFSSVATLVKSGGLHPTVVACNRLMDAYCRHGRLDEARQLFDEMPDRNVFSWNAIVHGHIRNGNLVGARVLFDSAPMKDSVTYNSMISGYVDESSSSEAVELFREMTRNGIPVDRYTLPTMLNLTSEMHEVVAGRLIHGFLVKVYGGGSDDFSVSALIDMYSKCGCFRDAFAVFDEMGSKDLVSRNAMVAACCREGKLKMAFQLFQGSPEMRDVVSWNTIITGCVQNGHAAKALELFVEMVSDAVRINDHTIVGILMACTSLKSLRRGKQVHAWMLINGFDLNPFVSSSMVDFYVKCNELRYADIVCSHYCRENVFAKTSLIVGHSQMGKLIEARRLFHSVGEKNPIVWTAIFNGYNNSQQCNEVFILFRKAAMETDPMASDVLVLISVLGACAIQTNLEHGKQIHSYLIRMCLDIEEKLGTALVDMYAKCGKIDYAEAIFQHVCNKDKILYNAMIAGLAHNRQGKEAINLFEEMSKEGLLPDAATFIALLSACRHAGLVESGEKFFNSMLTNYGIVPEIDHYSSMVDLLGRANKLDNALSLIKRIPFEQDAIIWGTFLNACRMNGNAEFVKEAEQNLLRIEMGNGSRYVQLANAYAAKGEWTEVERIRRRMRGGDVRKLTGCSWVQVDKKVNTFISGDRFHSEVEALYEILAILNSEMMDIGAIDAEIV